MKIITDQPERAGRWLAEKHKISYCKDESAVYIALEHKGEINVVFMYNGLIEHGSVQLHVAVEGRGNKEIRWYAFHYPFIELKVKKIIAPIQADNEKCIRFAINAGFVCEHIIKDAGCNGDLWIFSMTKEQCRFLK
jgi:L-amino acid N-acyltransferase YncA